jgi:hypothetical protein
MLVLGFGRKRIVVGFLELQPGTNLSLTGNLRASRCSECRTTRSISVHASEVHTVKQVEEIETQIEFHALGNVRNLFKGCIELSKTGIAELIDLLISFLP